MGGMAYLIDKGVQTYANLMTINIAREKVLPVPANGFKTRKVLKLNNTKIICYYPGAAHSMDNIVVWIPSEKILFAGCMAKAMDWSILGNTTDGIKEEYANTIRKVMRKFPKAEIVIPGHGDIGSFEVLEHTLQLTE